MTGKKKLLIGIFIVIAATQFFVSTENTSDYTSLTPFEKELGVTPLLSKDLQSQCYDCHSNHTVYPWYNHLGVPSLVLNHHIKEGKEHVNFSNWEQYSPKEKDHYLHEIYEEVSKNHMPLKLYKWTHIPKHSTLKQTRQRILEWASIFR